jgi:hypothetical protein
MPPRPMLLVASTRGPDAYRSSGLVLFVVIAFLARVHGDVVSTIKCQWRGVGRFQLKYVHTQLCCIYFGERRPRRVPEGRAGARYIAGDNWGRYDIGGSPDMGAMVLACALRQSIRRISLAGHCTKIEVINLSSLKDLLTCLAPDLTSFRDTRALLINTPHFVPNTQHYEKQGQSIF